MQQWPGKCLFRSLFLNDFVCRVSILDWAVLWSVNLSWFVGRRKKLDLFSKIQNFVYIK